MAKSKLQPGQEQQSGGKDPELWEQAPEQYVSNGDTLASMTGGDAGTYEGIVDYIMTGEEQSAPNEGEIVAAEDAGMLERNYPAEIDSSCEATPTPQRALPVGTGLSAQPTHAAPAAGTYNGTAAGLDAPALEGLDGAAAEASGVEGMVAGSLAHVGQYSGQGGEQPGGQIVPHTRDDAKLFKAASGSDPATLQAQNAATISSVDGVVSSLIAQIDGLMEGLNGGIQGAYNSSQASLDGTFSSSFDQISTAFGQARSDVDMGAADALDRIEQTTSEAHAHVDTQAESTIREISNLITTETSRLNAEANAAASAAVTAIATGQSNVQSATDNAVGEAGDVGSSLADEYRGRGNGGTEGKRDEARAQVAEQVAAAYQEDLPSAGTDAIAAMEEEKANIRSSIDAMVNPIILEAYPDLVEGSTTSVNDGAQALKDDLDASANDAADSVQTEHTNIHRDLNIAEGQALGQLVDIHSGASDDLAATDEAGRQSNEAIAAQMDYHIAQKKDQMDRLLGKNPMLPHFEVQREVEMVQQELDADGAAALDALEGQTDATTTALGEITGSANAAMGQVTTKAVSAAATMGADAVAGFDELATGFETSVDEAIGSYDQALSEFQTQIEAECANIYEQVTQGLATGVSSTEEGVAEFVQGFIDNLDQAINGTGDEQMVGTIRRVAEEEAAKIKEPSLWDRVVSVVAVVLVIAVVVAIAVLVPMALAALPAIAGVTLTSGTLIGAIAIGAITSLCTEIVMQFVEHGFDFSEWSLTDILRETFIGGVMGGFTFGLGNIVLRAGNAGRAAIAAGQSADDVVGVLNRIAAPLVRNADDLSVLGTFVTGFADNVVSSALTAGLSDEEFPSLTELLTSTGSGMITSAYTEGLADSLGLAEDNWRRDGFTGFIEELSSEASGGDIQALFERIEIDPAEVGGGDFTEDYQPTWSPTW